MMRGLVIILSLLCALSIAEGAGQGKHLFVLAGQSNMAGLKPNESFTPAVENAFGADNVIVVKDAKGGKPILRWYKKWKPKAGDAPEVTGDLYDRLMKKVRAAIEGQEIATVTFVWMQGEADTYEGRSELYAESLEGLYEQLSEDLGRKDVYFIVGRISDHGAKVRKSPHWKTIREAQMKAGEAGSLRAWVDTDDLNDGLNRKGEPIENDLHYSAEGYKILGERFAEKAIALIER